MNNKKEYLNEENYQRTKKKITSIALVILIVGILIGGGLIATGLIKSSNVESSVDTTRTKEVIQAEIDTLNNELVPLKAQKNQEFFANGLSEKYYTLNNEINKKQTKINELQSELFKLGSGFNSTKDNMAKSKYIPFYIFGAFIIIGSCMISFSVFMFAKRREITAFTVQQTMPLAQEGIEKMAPTIGNAAGTIGKGIAKGIKEGINGADENK